MIKAKKTLLVLIGISIMIISIHYSQYFISIPLLLIGYTLTKINTK